MISHESKQKYKHYVIYHMAKKHGISEQEAQTLMDYYGFDALMNDYPTETLHYPIEYWADEIYNAESAHLVR